MIAFDSETRLTAPGQQAPELACITVAGPGWTDIRDPSRIWETLTLGFSDILVGHHVAFDLAVFAANGPPATLAFIVELLDRNRITDTLLRERLIDTASGRNTKRSYGLADVVRRRFNVHLGKAEDTWRLRYGELIGIPIHQWPADAVKYAIDDARFTLAVAEAQEDRVLYLEDQFRQTRAAFWLHLMHCWGVRTSAAGVAELEAVTRERLSEIEGEMRACGFLRPDRVLKSGPRRGVVEPGTKNMTLVKEAVVAAYAKLGRQYRNRWTKEMYPYPTTKTGEPETSGDACEESEDAHLLTFADFAQLRKVLDEDVPALSRGTVEPVHPRITPLLETGRISMSDPNLTNRSRQMGKHKDGSPKAITILPDIRGCVIPRPGKVFITCDFGSVELCALGQTCIDLIGYSTLATMLNEGIDPLTKMASEELLGISYDDGKARRKLDEDDPLHKAFDLVRQTSKVAMYGFPGGLGPATFVHFARKSYGVRITEDEARRLKDAWLRLLPEMREYQRLMGQLVEAPGAQIVLPRSRRFRGGCTYNQASNSFFQGPASDAAKDAGWEIMKKCYLQEGNPLFGSRTVNFVHDDFIAESEPEIAPEAAEELSTTMIASARKWFPDVKVKAPPLVSVIWSKKASPVRDANGRLVCWYPALRAVAA